jgi:hypothetical protein
MKFLAGLPPARTICATLLLLFAMTTIRADAQFTQAPPTPTFPPPPGTEQQQPKSPMERQVDRQAAKQRNIQRQQDIKRDTEKLLELATELKQYVDKTNENIISLDVIKKADQIEKLAKSVKEKMKQ